MDKKSRDLVMGKLYLKNKDYKMAEKSLIEYLNYSPEDFQALKMLAQVYENLNNTQKAFESYEQAYLVDPERKGTLLDICRVLLIEKSGLEHVDRKKWLRLAIQAFPTNPIVTSLRDVLPIEEINQAPVKAHIDDKVMAMLNQLDQRLASIEESLASLKLQLISPVQTQVQAQIPVQVQPQATIKLQPQTPPQLQSTSQAQPQISPQVQPQVQPQTSPQVQPQTPPQVQPQVLPQTSPQVQLQASPIAKPETTPKAVSQVAPQSLFQTSTQSPLAKPFSFQTSLFGSSITQSAPKPTLPASPAPVVAPAPAASQPPQPTTTVAQPTTVTQTKPVAFPSLFSLSTSLEPPAPVNLSKPATPSTQSSAPEKTESVFKPLTGGFSFGSSGLTSGNLFANGLQKYNLPSEGLWATEPSTTPKKTEERNDDDAGDGDGDGKEELVDAPELPIENNCELEPIEIKSGEEDEDVIFEHRCKLFRFKDKEYKERGLGNIKVLKHRTTGAGRLIMRRDLINLVCLNCWSCSKIQRLRDTQVRFAGLDASDGVPETTVFLAKFKTQEMTDKFISHLQELFPDE